MIIMKDVFLYKCLEILKRPEVKSEIKDFLRPLIDLILQEIYPYIYLSILLLRNSQFIINSK